MTRRKFTTVEDILRSTSDYITVYHVTPLKYRASILREGLKPSSKKRPVSRGISSPAIFVTPSRKWLRTVAGTLSRLDYPGVRKFAVFRFTVPRWWLKVDPEIADDMELSFYITKPISAHRLRTYGTIST